MRLVQAMTMGMVLMMNLQGIQFAHARDSHQSASPIVQTEQGSVEGASRNRPRRGTACTRPMHSATPACNPTFLVSKMRWIPALRARTAST